MHIIKDKRNVIFFLCAINIRARHYKYLIIQFKNDSENFYQTQIILFLHSKCKVLHTHTLDVRDPITYTDLAVMSLESPRIHSTVVLVM